VPVDSASPDKADSSHWWGWLVAAFVGGAAITTGNKPTDTPSPPTTSNGDTTVNAKKGDALRVELVPPTEDEPPIYGPRLVLDDLCKNRPEFPPKLPGGLFGGLISEIPGWYDLRRMECFIATVPDPVRSQFAVDFDSDVEAIQWAFQSQGYILVRSWLPWRVKKSGTQNKPETDKERMRHPGALLFWRVNNKLNGPDGLPQVDLALVQLVGETAIRGMDREMLENALTFLRTWFPTQVRNKPVRVLGPHFSGSQGSLSSVLASFVPLIEGDRSPNGNGKGPPAFDVITGSASEMKPSYYFNRDGSNYERKGKIRFRATVIPNRLLRSAVYHYLANAQHGQVTLGDPGSDDGTLLKALTDKFGKLAILRESNTAFGNASVGSIDGSAIDLPFPIAIAHLKKNFDQWRQVVDAKLKTAEHNPLIPPVPPRDDDVFDRVTERDPDTSAVVKAEQLADILAIIKRERIKIVGIQASDARDILFLSSLLYEYCPDVRTFTTTTDTLLTVPQERHHMRGMIVASTYPLFLPNQGWTRTGASKQLPFSSEHAQGYYNAVLALMGSPEAEKEMIEYGAPRFAGPTDRPPIWICAISQDGNFVPLRFYPNYNTAGDQIGAKAVYARSHFQVVEGTRVSFDNPVPVVLMAALLSASGLWLYYSGVRKRRALIFWDTGGAIPPRVTLGRGLCFLAVLMSLAPLTLIILGYGTFGGFAGGYLGLFLAFVLVGVVAILALLLALLQPLRNDSPVLRAVLGVLGVAFVSAIAVYWFLHDQGVGGRVLFVVRATDSATGLSILVPILLLNAALFSMGYLILKQAYTAEAFRVGSPFPVTATPTSNLELIGNDGEQLRADFTSPLIWAWRKPNRVVVVAASAVFVGFVGYFLHFRLPSLEGVLWDYSIIFSFVIVGMLVAFNLLRLVMLWGSLKRFLRRITDLNMGRAFDRLTAPAATLFGSFLLMTKPRLTHLAHPVNALRRLANCFRKMKETPDVTPVLDDANQKKAEEITGAFDKAVLEKVGDHKVSGQKIRDDVSAIAACAIAKLADGWRNAPPVHEPTSNDLPEDHAIAEEILAFQVASYLSQFFALLRNLAASMSLCASLLLIAVASYPFVPGRALLFTHAGLVIVVALAILWVLIGMNRNDTINRICKTPTGFTLTDSSFISAVVTFVVPVLVVVIVQVFVGFRPLFEPILRVAR
jgi:hypothetical protein